MRSTWFPTRVGSNLARRQPGGEPVRHEARGAQHGWAKIFLKGAEKPSRGKTNESLFSCKKSDNLEQVERRWQWCLWSVMSVQSLHLSYPESASLPLVSASEKRLAAAKKISAKQNFFKKVAKKLSQKNLLHPESGSLLLPLLLPLVSASEWSIWGLASHTSSLATLTTVYTTIYQRSKKSTKSNTSTGFLYTLLSSNAHYTTIYQRFLNSTKSNTSTGSIYTLLCSTAVQYVNQCFCIVCI